MLELISVHVPKCVGTSLREAFQQAYGKEQVFLDYGDRLLNPNALANRDPAAYLTDFHQRRDALLQDKKVAHGHFWVAKYDGIEARRITFLRHPIDRLISHYYFWLTYPPHSQPLHDQFLREKPSLAEFALFPGMRYFYSRVYFHDVNMASFDLVGATEKLPQSMAALAQLTGHTLTLAKSNETLTPHYREHKLQIEQDKALQNTLRDLLAQDIDFYERHVSVT